MATKYVTIGLGSKWMVGSIDILADGSYSVVDVLVEVDGTLSTANVVKNRLQYAYDNGI